MLLTIKRRKKRDMLTVQVVKVKYNETTVLRQLRTIDAKDKPPTD